MMALLLLFTIDIWAQSGMTDTQILQYVIQQKRLGKAESEIATELLKQGATLAQIQQMRQKYSQQLEKVSMGGVVDKAIGDASSRMTMTKRSTTLICTSSISSVSHRS